MLLMSNTRNTSAIPSPATLHHSLMRLADFPSLVLSNSALATCVCCPEMISPACSPRRLTATVARVIGSTMCPHHNYSFPTIVDREPMLLPSQHPHAAHGCWKPVPYEAQQPLSEASRQRGSESSRTASLCDPMEAVADRFRPSFSPAVLPACHKQRSRAVCSGQSRSLGEGCLAGRTALTWPVLAPRNCMACKGSRLGSGLAVPRRPIGPARSRTAAPPPPS
jgi:hypothetical protein